MIDRSLAPTTQTIDNLIFKNPTNFVLRNRIPAFVFESSLHEVLKFDLVFDAGTALQTSPLVAGLTLKMLRHGTKTYPGSRFSTQLESCGAYIQQHITKDDSVITFLFLKKNLLKVLPLIESLLNEPSFSENEFRLLRRTEKEEFIVSHEKPRNQAAILFNT